MPLREFLSGLFKTNQPKVVVTGFGRGEVVDACFELSSACNAAFGIFAEQPMLSSWPKRMARRKLYKKQWKKTPPAFVLGVGDRAVEFYSGLLANPLDASFFAYYQDLRPVFAIPDRKPSEKLRFLFSGRLVEQHNIRALAEAFERLAATHPGRFEWCVSGSGAEEKWVRNAMARSSVLNLATTFDVEFTSWNDRLRPLAGADVLVLPSFHAGWGLVVPEALGSGIPVISTRGVEAARYFIEHGVNGLFVNPNVDSIYGALAYCVDHPAKVHTMARFTRAGARRGDVTVGAEKLLAIIARWL
jgi:glycosyltransferase involved in cell wall biosynthesis